jgi:PAS domain S-box-containing protein
VSEPGQIILHIDDEKAIRQSVKAFLEDYGYIVVSAKDGRHGLEAFAREKPDMVLVDLRMPEVDGLDVLSHVNKTAPDIPVIVISGTGVIGNVIEALRLGAWNYLLKPIHDMNVLLHAVEKGFERARLIRENRDYQENLETKIKAQTRELYEKNIALKDSEEYFRSIIENSNDLIAILDTSALIKYASPSHERILGYRSEQLTGKKFYTYVHQEDLEVLTSELEELSRLKQRSTDLKFRYKCNNGVWRYIEGTASNLLDQPSVKGIIVNYRDVTEQQVLESQLVQAQKMEAIGHLAGGVAHDFNNLLTVISGYANLLMFDELLQEQHKTKIDQIIRATERAEALVRQLLAFSRKQIVQPEILDVNGHIQDSMKMLTRLIGEDIMIRFEQGGNLQPIMADPHQFEQIILNLMINARDAIHSNESSENQKRITITTGHIEKQLQPTFSGNKNTRTYLEIAITDTGIGMDRQTVDKIFDPFFTTKKQGKGTGLGLSTVYGIVKQNKALIDVRSEPGKGTTFKIQWPVAEPRKKWKTAKKEHRIPFGNEEILFVEDDEAVRTFAEEALKSFGYVVHFARNGEDAIGKLETDEINPNLLITDIILPGMDGWELSRQIKKILPDINILFTSGYSDNELVDKALLEEGVHFLEKPYTISDISSRIREILDR